MHGLPRPLISHVMQSGLLSRGARGTQEHTLRHLRQRTICSCHNNVYFRSRSFAQTFPLGLLGRTHVQRSWSLSPLIHVSRFATLNSQSAEFNGLSDGQEEAAKIAILEKVMKGRQPTDLMLRCTFAPTTATILVLNVVGGRHHPRCRRCILNPACSGLSFTPLFTSVAA
jgi:hypothetical protein